MGYGRYIGYVATLAVALGVGAAVATTPGIAYALPADTGSESPTTGETAPTDTPIDTPTIRRRQRWIARAFAQTA